MTTTTFNYYKLGQCYRKLSSVELWSSDERKSNAYAEALHKIFLHHYPIRD